MTEPKNPAESFIAKLKHYKSSKGGESDKRIVVELVQEGSASADFLKRMEEKRRAQAASRVIDMRGKVEGACRSYEHDKRTHYMDERCIQIFEKSLADSNGSYTLGVYEDVTNASHTHKARHQREQQQQEQLRKQGILNPLGAITARTSQPGSTGLDLVNDSASPYPPIEIIQLGYQVQRREPRMTFIMDIELLLANGKRISAKTRDISRHGIKITTAPNPELKDQSRVRVQFMTLLAEHALKQARPVEYRIMGQELDGDKLVLRLLQENFHAQPEFDRFLVQFIEQNSHRYKIELTDAIHALKAKVFERFLTPVLAHVPLFIRLLHRQSCQVELIAATSMNASLLQYFINAGGDLDLSQLLSDQRMQWLSNQAPETAELLVYSFYSEVSGKKLFYSACEHEFANAPQQQQFIYLGLNYDSFRVYQLKLSPIHFPEDERLRGCVAALAHKSAEDSELLLKRILGLTHKLSLFDLTAHLHLTSGLKTGDIGLTQAPQFLMPFSRPSNRQGSYELVNLGLRAHRSEPRYLHQTDVEISLSKQKYTGHTRDLSVRGMQVQLDTASSLQKGDLVMVSLSKLQKQVKDAQLTEMPYRVVATQHQGQTLMLERDERSADSSSDFFRRLIRNNADRLAQCLGDSVAEAEAKLMESLTCSELSTLPFFISKTPDESYLLSQIAISETAHPLLTFFTDGQNRPDLRALANPSLLQELMSALKTSKSGYYETELYVYRNANRELHYGSSSDFASTRLRQEFIQQAQQAPDRRLMLVRVSPSQGFHENEFEAEFESLRQQSKNQAKLLTDDLQNVVAVGDLIDLTPQILQRELKEL